jgi:DNA-binding transcriptional LysR family regulator
MIDWEDVRHFLAVAQSGSLSGAARRLKVDHATVSRRLAALEAELDVRLIDRLPRSSRLTAVGMQVLERAIEMEAGADGIDRLAKAAHAPLVGRVTLSAPPVLVMHLFAEKLVRFQAQYPNILLSMSAEGRQVSLGHRESDVAVRLTRPDEARTIARKVGAMVFGLYARRDYVHLTTPERWRFIAFDQGYADMPQQKWLLGIAGARSVACELNYISEHFVAAKAGVGVAGLPCFLAERDPDLIRIEQGTPSFGRDVWLAIHHDMRKTPAIRAVMDFVTDTVQECGDLSLR